MKEDLLEPIRFQEPMLEPPNTFGHSVHDR